MSEPIELVLPYPVSANRYWRTFRGRHVRSAEADEFRATVDREAASAGLWQPIDGPVRVAVGLHPIAPQNAAQRARKLGALWHLGVRCIDLDNCQKVAIDALQGIAYANDNQIVDIRTQRLEPVVNGALVVRVSRWQPS